MATLLANGTTVLVPTNTFLPGTYHSAVFALSAGQSSITITAARNNWPDTGTPVVSMAVELSPDGGTTWQLLVGFSATGGVTINPWTKVADPNSIVGIAIPDPQNANRQVRATINVVSTINTSVSALVA